MTLVGLDIDSTRARAVSGPMAQMPLPVRLAEPNAELALALSLEGRQPVVGRAAWTLCRRLPDSACLDFLPYLDGTRVWRRGRHRLDASRALGLVLEHLARSLGRSQAVAAALPAYLTGDQVTALVRLADKARLRLNATTPTPLAAALGAHELLPWSGQALILDVDGHALTWSAVLLSDDSARLLASRSFRNLGRDVWLARLLDGVAGRCVRLSRRDPRESADAEQYLYEQLLQLVEVPPAAGQSAELVVQSAQWYQRLAFSPSDFVNFCDPLTRMVIGEMQAILAATAAHGPVGALLVTAPASSLPGVLAALQAVMHRPETAPAGDEEDFGEGLLQEEPRAAGGVFVLAADAVARGAHDLAGRAQRGEVRGGALEAVPLPPTRGTAAPKLHTTTQDDSPRSRTRIPFPSGDSARGMEPAPPAAAPLPARRWPRPQEE
jgi:hypothetical protein